MNSTITTSAILAFTLSPAFAVFAQVESSPQTPPPVSYASVNQLNSVLSQIQQMSEAVLNDLGKARVDHWKTDSSSKRQAQADVQSIQRNLQSALPEMMNQLRSSPEDLTATFKLYRNLDALYDVFGPLVESAGAFGSKDDYQALSNDLHSLEASRRSLADRMDGLTSSKEAELNRLRTQIRTLAEAPPAPPKKVVVDDTEEAKPAKKKGSKKSSKSSTNSKAGSAQPSPSENQPPSQPQ
ncbi:MAG TPA: hypothetical protein VFA89_08350 [Terriglobales bacterium]|nr:hypothetical protein [Terriglobales bacterium]